MDDKAALSPSRSAILTGRYVRGLEEGGILLVFLRASLTVFTLRLEDAVYEIGAVGKTWSPGRMEGWKAEVLGKNRSDRKLAGEDRRPGLNSTDYPANFEEFPPGRDPDKPSFFWLRTSELRQAIATVPGSAPARTWPRPAFPAHCPTIPMCGERSSTMACGRGRAEELYDLKASSHQLRNITADPAMTEVNLDLLWRFDAYLRAHGEQGPAAGRAIPRCTRVELCIAPAGPAGTYARRFWFLSECLTGGNLDFSDAKDVRHVSVLSPAQQVGIDGETLPRYRLRHNQSETPDFCPLVRARPTKTCQQGK